MLEDLKYFYSNEESVKLKEVRNHSNKYSKSKFSQNTTNLLSIKVATCFDSRSHHQANY